MSIYSETKLMTAAQASVAEEMAPADDSRRPVHFPHAIAYWAITMQRALIAHLAEYSSDPEAQTQTMQEALSAAFMTGFKYAERAHTYTNCDCGTFTASNVEELMSNAWRHEFNRTHPSTEPREE